MEKAKEIIKIYETFMSLSEAGKQEAIQEISKVNKQLAEALKRIQAGDHEQHN